MKKFQVNLVGQKDGYYYEYYPDNKIKSISLYKNDVIDSVQNWFYHSGRKLSDLFYLEGRKFGSQYMYDSEGRLEQQYFVTSACDSCITTIISLDKEGAIIKKDGSIIHCIYKNETLKRGDAAQMIFYVIVPPSYNSTATIIEKKIGGYLKRNSCNLSLINNNLAYFYSKSFESVGKYEVDFHISITNSQSKTSFSDSISIPIAVR